MARFIVKGPKGSIGGDIKVVASDASHAIEVARLMIDQGIRGVTVHEVNSGRDTDLADFVIQRGRSEAISNTDYS